MKNINYKKAFLGGFLATLGFVLVLYGAPFLRMPGIDIAGMLGELITRSPAMFGKGPWFVGLVACFFIGGIVLPLLFVPLVYSRLALPGWIKGMAWGILLWVLAEAVLIPLMGMGFFSILMPETGSILATTSLSQLVYGTLLGGIYQLMTRDRGTSHRSRARIAA